MIVPCSELEAELTRTMESEKQYLERGEVVPTRLCLKRKRLESELETVEAMTNKPPELGPSCLQSQSMPSAVPAGCHSSAASSSCPSDTSADEADSASALEIDVED